MTAPELPVEARPTEPGDAQPCRICRQWIVATDLGWMHIDHRGLVGWLCDPPHYGLAHPSLYRSSAAPAPSPTAGMRASRDRTPIPPRPNVRQANAYPPPAAPRGWPPSNEEQR
jgi:hypothetical protein